MLAEAATRGLRGLLARTLRSARWLAGAIVGALVVEQAEDSAPMDGHEQRWRTLLLVGEVALTAVLYGLTAAGLIGAGDDLGSPYSPQLLHVVALAVASPLLLRRSSPLMAWRVALLVLFAASLSVRELFPAGYGLPLLVPILLTVYSATSRTRPRVAVGVWLVTVVALTPLASDVWLVGAGTASTIPLFVTIAALLGYNVRARRDAQRRLAVQERHSLREREARAVLEERARIARELHDVVAHHMSVIAIQAEAAPLQVPDLPDALRSQLAQIRATSLEALAEMRRILGVLRDDGEHPDTAPQPGLDRLDDLVANARAAGLTVTSRVAGEAVGVPPGVALSAYRIVQESLSNVMRHAPGATVEVELAFERRPAALTIRVTNDPPPVPASGPAGDVRTHGLLGMRERAAMLQGRLTAGPTPGGGYEVVASLPLEGA